VRWEEGYSGRRRGENVEVVEEGNSTYLEGMRLTPSQPIDRRTSTQSLPCTNRLSLVIGGRLGDGLVCPID